VIVEIVTFKALPGANWQAILADARTTIPRWWANRELKCKHYVLSEDGKTSGGVYIWPSREAAEKAHDATWRSNVEKRTGAMPTVVYFDLMMLPDNEAGTVPNGRKRAKNRWFQCPSALVKHHRSPYTPPISHAD
jgi:hypothetical protein